VFLSDVNLDRWLERQMSGSIQRLLHKWRGVYAITLTIKLVMGCECEILRFRECASGPKS